jgi:hypothetical protein
MELGQNIYIPSFSPVKVPCKESAALGEHLVQPQLNPVSPSPCFKNTSQRQQHQTVQSHELNETNMIGGKMLQNPVLSPSHHPQHKKSHFCW